MATDLRLVLRLIRGGGVEGFLRLGLMSFGFGFGIIVVLLVIHAAWPSIRAVTWTRRTERFQLTRYADLWSLSRRHSGEFVRSPTLETFRYYYWALPCRAPALSR